MTGSNHTPLVIEAAITPLRIWTPVQQTDDMIREAKACLAAGAGIIHFHHHFGTDNEFAIEQLIDVTSAIAEDYPEALVYPDYLKGRAIWEKNAHLQPMRDAGVLTMMAMDPGLTLFGRYDDRGLPSVSIRAGANFVEADQLVTFANQGNTPVSIGIYEPGHLRWTLAYAAKGAFPKGSIIKLYFGGEHLIDQERVKGMTFGLYPTPASLDVYLSMMADCDLPWIVSVHGDNILDMPLARYTLERGGHIRVGIEDTAGTSLLTNVEAVQAVVALAGEVGRPVATAAQAKALLSGQLEPT
ncbi:hypothetical protein BH10PSE13_BH10PSE13_05930 [soil metagenome]